MVDVVILIVIALIIIGAFAYIHKAKKSGQKCIGCPYSKTCGGGSCDCAKDK